MIEEPLPLGRAGGADESARKNKPGRRENFTSQENRFMADRSNGKGSGLY